MSNYASGFSVGGKPWLFSLISGDTDVFQDEENDDFLSISRAMEEIVDDPVDCYWLIKCFVNQFHTKFGDSVPHLVSLPRGCHFHPAAVVCDGFVLCS